MLKWHIWGLILLPRIHITHSSPPYSVQPMFSVHSQSCAITQQSILEPFPQPRKNPMSINSHCPFRLNPPSLPHQPQAVTNFLSVSIDLATLDISYKCNYTIRGLL